MRFLSRKAEKPPDEVTVQGTGPADPSDDLVQAGDFLAVYESIVQSNWYQADLPGSFKKLFKAIDVASHKDPAGFSDNVFHVMMATSAYLSLRAQYVLISQIESDDGTARGRAPVLPSMTLSRVFTRCIRTSRN